MIDLTYNPFPIVPHCQESVDLFDVGYQVDSIVSRVLFKTRFGSVTLFAVGQGQAINESRSATSQMLQMLEGECFTVISGNLKRLTVGELILIPAEEPCTIRALGRFKMLLTQFKV